MPNYQPTKRDWLACFSQRGDEIYNLVREFNRWPNTIITNNPKVESVLARDYLYSKCPPFDFHELPVRPHAEDYVEIVEQYKEPIITLHGFLRIVPPTICEKYEIYNLHPGLITSYPELKGKDPQERAWEGKYPYIGAVIHKVTAGVDEGEIMVFKGIKNNCKSLDETYNVLKNLSFNLWKEFLPGLLV